MSGTLGPADSILTACVAAIQQAIALLMPGGGGNPSDYCDVQPDGHPPSRMGNFFVSIDITGVQASGKNFLREKYSLTVFSTRRVSVLPADRKKQAYSYWRNGLGAVERAVLVAMLQNKWTIMQAANGFLAGGDIFQHPLAYTGRPRGSFRGADWAGKASGDDTFLVWELPFDGMTRIQSLDVLQ